MVLKNVVKNNKKLDNHNVQYLKNSHLNLR